jgi:hypothetical protein
VRNLIDELQRGTTVDTAMADRLFNVRLLDYSDAVRRAMKRFSEDAVDTSWTDAVASSNKPAGTLTSAQHDGLIHERFEIETTASNDSVFHVICGLGGEAGWPYANALWKVRGLIDLLAGGVGLRKARRTYTHLRVGDTVDFWRVESLEKNRLLRLRAEMKLPGRAWLQYEIEDRDDRRRIVQTAFFEPRGIPGLLYWYLFYVPHRFIFPGLLRKIRSRSESGTQPAPRGA